MNPRKHPQKEEPLTVYYLRHGENEANLYGVFTSRKLDHALTEQGWEQSRQVTEFLTTQPQGDGPVFSSPTQRARQTASVIAERLRKPVQVLDELYELDVGSLEGQSGPDAESYWRSVLRDWADGKRDTRFDGGENHFELTERLQRSFAKLRALAGPGPVVLAGHAGLLRVGFRNLATPLPAVDLAIPNCSVSCLHLGAADQPFRFAYWARSDFLNRKTSAEKP